MLIFPVALFTNIKCFFHLSVKPIGILDFSSVQHNAPTALLILGTHLIVDFDVRIDCFLELLGEGNSIVGKT